MVVWQGVCVALMDETSVGHQPTAHNRKWGAVDVQKHVQPVSERML